MQVSTHNLFETYAAKYGPSSNYPSVQQVEYTHPEVQRSFQLALDWVDIRKGDLVLDIGVNNGFEISLIKNHYKKIWSSLSVIGIDLVKDVLTQAVKDFSLDLNVRFVHGDARTFVGIDVRSGNRVAIDEGSIDVVIALTSLQSSSFQENLDEFVANLVSKLGPSARLLIAIPDCHVADGHMIKGQFNANTQSIDYVAAQDFCGTLTKLLVQQGFSVRTTGEYFRFLVFSRN